MRNFFLWVCLFIAASPFAAAQGVSFSASVDRTRLSVGERFEITFVLNGSTQGKNFRPPSFNDFLVLSGPNQSTNMQLINGTMSSTISYSYILQPRSEGTFALGSASIEYGGKQFQTEPIAIEVLKGAPPPKQHVRQPEESDIGRQIGDNLFLRLILDRSRLYQGEQLTATYKLYTRVGIVNYGVAKAPSFSGFWSEDLEVPKQIQLSSEVINGKQYRVGILKTVALFPQKSGTLEIDPMEIECVVQVQTRRRSTDLFDQFFNDPFLSNISNVNHKVRSETQKVTVLPLPASNVPIGFQGAVGKYTMEAWLDKPHIKTNEAVTLKVKISGRGNLKLLAPPAITISPDIERYDPKISDNITKQRNQIAGSRTFEYLLIPRLAGEQKIPPFSFSYFDVERKNYVSLTGPELKIDVERGSEFAPSAVSNLSKEDIQLLGEDIRFIKSGDPSFRRKGERLVGSPMFYMLSTSPVLAFLGIILFIKQREKLLGDGTTRRNRRAKKIALRRFAEAKKFQHAGKREEFTAELSRAL